MRGVMEELFGLIGWMNASALLWSGIARNVLSNRWQLR